MMNNSHAVEDFLYTLFHLKNDRDVAQRVIG